MKNTKPAGPALHHKTFCVFYLFLEYWQLNGEAKFKHLCRIWKKNHWPISELFVIFEKIDERDELFNPNIFYGEELFYIEHVKTCLLLDF